MATRTASPQPAPSGDAPRRFRGPFARWPRAADAVLAVVALLVAVFVADGPGDSVVIRTIGDVPIPALLGIAVASAALYWRRRAPLLVLAAALTCWVVVLLVSPGYADVGLATAIALYSTGRYGPAGRWGPAGVAAAFVLVNLDGLDDPTPWWEVAFLGALFMFGVWYVGRRLRLRQERAAELRRERAAEARRIVTEERARIARELHDVVAHRVSLMTVQAGGAKAVADEDPQAARQAMGAVEEAGRQALAELRHLLGVLRPESAAATPSATPMTGPLAAPTTARPDHDELGPQPGLADLPRLAGQVRRAGVDLALSTEGLPNRLPARLDLFAYRIVQEALTNVLKHAGPGAHAAVRLRTDRNEILIEVLDDGCGGTVAAAPGGTQNGSQGHGIIGMRERALLLGGSLEVGPRAGGGFRVVAHLPLIGEPG